MLEWSLVVVSWMPNIIREVTIYIPTAITSNRVCYDLSEHNFYINLYVYMHAFFIYIYIHIYIYIYMLVTTNSKWLYCKRY